MWVQGKPIIAVLETDRSRGALSESECRDIVTQPKADGTTWFTEPKARAGTSFLLGELANEWCARGGSSAA